MKAQVKKADSRNACFVFLAAHEEPKGNGTKSLHVHVVSGHSCIQLKPPFGSNLHYFTKFEDEMRFGTQSFGLDSAYAHTD